MCWKSDALELVVRTQVTVYIARCHTPGTNQLRSTWNEYSVCFAVNGKTVACKPCQEFPWQPRACLFRVLRWGITHYLNISKLVILAMVKHMDRLHVASVHLFPVEKKWENLGGEETQLKRVICTWIFKRHLLAESKKTHLMRSFTSCRGRLAGNPVDAIEEYNWGKNTVDAEVNPSCKGTPAFKTAFKKKQRGTKWAMHQI